MKDKLLWVLVIASMLIGFALVGVFAMYEFTDAFATITPTPTKTPTATATPTVTLTPTATATPTPNTEDLWLLPERDLVTSLLSESYDNVLALGLATKGSLFVVFVDTAQEKVMLAEIAVVGGEWVVLRAYPMEDKPTPTPGFPGSRES